MSRRDGTNAVALPNRGKLTLRLDYWHQHPDGESLEHHTRLVRLFNHYLRLLNRERQKFSWDCRFVPLKPGMTRPYRIVSVQVRRSAME